MTPKQALVFVKKHGVVLASAKGPVPRMTEIIAGETIKASWWAHAKSRQIYAVLRSLENDPDILVCRLVGGKVSFVHRRLWPALIRAAKNFPAEHLAQQHDEHTKAGHHVGRSVKFPKWADKKTLAQARDLSEQDALAMLGAWASPR
ncbi:MAG TPA: hypothetical protein VNN98_03020 [Rhizomicrobium sp.]|nr:hypothetical protein [Rhizomicrobium sp.]